MRKNKHNLTADLVGVQTLAVQLAGKSLADLQGQLAKAKAKADLAEALAYCNQADAVFDDFQNAHELAMAEVTRVNVELAECKVECKVELAMLKGGAQ